MKLSTAATSAAVLLSTASPAVHAFGPSPSITQRQQQSSSRTTSTRLSLIPIDPVSAMQSTSLVTSSGEFIESLGQLALIGSVGMGVVMGNKNNKDWSYEYKPGNEYASDLALMEESPTSVMEKVEAEAFTVAKDTTESQRTFFGITASKAAPKAEPVPKVTAAKPAKATTPSKELLASTEKAKAEVAKKGVQATKDKISSKTSTPPSSSKEEKEAGVAVVASMEVAETKKTGGKRKILKGVTLIVAAGLVAVGRNVVKAYLGRGMV